MQTFADVENSLRAERATGRSGTGKDRRQRSQAKIAGKDRGQRSPTKLADLDSRCQNCGKIAISLAIRSERRSRSGTGQHSWYRPVPTQSESDARLQGCNETNVAHQLLPAIVDTLDGKKALGRTRRCSGEI
jgi:ribosomal protein L44E